MKERNDIEALIIRSLDKTATEEELGALKQWINQSEHNKQSYFEFKDVWDATEAKVPSRQKAWKKVEAQLSVKRILPGWAMEILKIASVALVVAFATYSAFKLPQIKETDSTFVRVIVPNGSQSTVELADGTKVKLNAGSELIYPSVFNRKERHITLKGEAYFSVHHDKAHPFIVSAGDIEVRVLGTEFNVMAYPETERIETTLVEGSVSLNRAGADYTKGIILKPGQKAIYAQGKMAVNQANLALVTNWTNKGFNFQNTSLEELVIRLERWYDVDIIIQSEAAKQLSFTGKFRNKETIWQILDAIKMITPIDYTIKDDKIYITLITE
ncbi:DUF4974 domain-containing protein [Carboxylicivirga sp. A043]|uniref:FecR family protein n=1 Tax=Carboxylicivirga litoralis TaxID=2816963 RepID=UPI0021CB6F2A|nr:FecR domain-containing protein [Carboxylicivirga sp. A043]MCU4157487.1 DUF4974 domain-containing protein [Carboxylicivirga sp. A043]